MDRNSLNILVNKADAAAKDFVGQEDEEVKEFHVEGEAEDEGMEYLTLKNETFMISKGLLGPKGLTKELRVVVQRLNRCRCRCCWSTFAGETLLKQHVKEKHRSEFFTCECKEEFHSRDSFNKHLFETGHFKMSGQMMWAVEANGRITMRKAAGLELLGITPYV